MRWTILWVLFAGCAERPVGDGEVMELAREVRLFSVDALDVRTDKRSGSMDLDGDGDPDDQVAQVIGGLFAWNSDLDAAADWAIANGAVAWQLGEERDGEAAKVFYRASGSDARVVLEGGPAAAGPAPAEVRIELPILVGEAPLALPIRGLRVEYHAAGDGAIAGRLGGVVPRDAIARELIPGIVRLINARIAAEESDSEVAPLLANLDWGAGCATAGDRRVDACELAEQPFWKRTMAPDVDDGLSFSLGFAAHQR